MKRPTLLGGVAVAAVMAGAALSLSTAFSGKTAGEPPWQPALLLLAAAYLGYLLAGSEKKAGKITLSALCLTALAAAYALEPPVYDLLILCAGTICAIRSWLNYTGILAAAADLALCLAGLAFALWAYSTGAGLAAAVWCFFLVQSLTALIPQRIAARPRLGKTPETNRFERAYRTAETALKRLAGG
ncbi:MAG: hypothetical protein ACU833_04585 [Gammaproteobacteria bacterium]